MAPPWKTSGWRRSGIHRMIAPQGGRYSGTFTTVETVLNPEREAQQAFHLFREGQELSQLPARKVQRERQQPQLLSLSEWRKTYKRDKKAQKRNEHYDNFIRQQESIAQKKLSKIAQEEAQIQERINNPGIFYKSKKQIFRENPSAMMGPESQMLEEEKSRLEPFQTFQNKRESLTEPLKVIYKQGNPERLDKSYASAIQIMSEKREQEQEEQERERLQPKINEGYLQQQEQNIKEWEESNKKTLSQNISNEIQKSPSISSISFNKPNMKLQREQQKKEREKAVQQLSSITEAFDEDAAREIERIESQYEIDLVEIHKRMDQDINVLENELILSAPEAEEERDRINDKYAIFINELEEKKKDQLSKIQNSLVSKKREAATEIEKQRKIADDAIKNIEQEKKNKELALKKIEQDAAERVRQIQGEQQQYQEQIQIASDPRTLETLQTMQGSGNDLDQTIRPTFKKDIIDRYFKHKRKGRFVDLMSADAALQDQKEPLSPLSRGLIQNFVNQERTSQLNKKNKEMESLQQEMKQKEEIKDATERAWEEEKTALINQAAEALRNSQLGQNEKEELKTLIGKKQEDIERNKKEFAEKYKQDLLLKQEKANNLMREILEQKESEFGRVKQDYENKLKTQEQALSKQQDSRLSRLQKWQQDPEAASALKLRDYSPTSQLFLSNVQRQHAATKAYEDKLKAAEAERIKQIEGWKKDYKDAHAMSDFRTKQVQEEYALRVKLEEKLNAKIKALEDSVSKLAPAKQDLKTATKAPEKPDPSKTITTTVAPKVEERKVQREVTPVINPSEAIERYRRDRSNDNMNYLREAARNPLEHNSNQQINGMTGTRGRLVIPYKSPDFGSKDLGIPKNIDDPYSTIFGYFDKMRAAFQKETENNLKNKYGAGIMKKHPRKKYYYPEYDYSALEKGKYDDTHALKIFNYFKNSKYTKDGILKEIRKP